MGGKRFLCRDPVVPSVVVLTPSEKVWSMTAQAALRAALRDVVAPAARADGFKGSAPTWRITNAQGDWAVVDVQSSAYSTSESLRCVINLAVAPAPWLAWQQQSLGSLPKAISESLGLYRLRLHPTGTPPGRDGWWEISGERDASAAATDMTRQLAIHGWPTLKRLMDRDALLDQIRSGDLGYMKAKNFPVFFARAEALMLAENGSNPRIEELLADATANVMPAQHDNAVRFAEWVRNRAARSE
ncbi:uncharacterized protein DUF4304 [Micromonospora kangleipakensis]|uniref:Uncharacterized protein DUF4304 n=1 Tax=Micromonospora kangleipakensis TaxID=1077942 RepID=A0A4V2GCW1_9ACTN|nr:DUF4304 domain-containing protein [Micromonospora kangleipakensis]RZU73576.1 uncharacterized protein DUF4304 [Micromonospora kangleipakensis]